MASEMLALYVDLRRACLAFEICISERRELTADELKRLDKATTVMKLGFKLVKQVLRARGVEDLKQWREPLGVTPNV